MVVYNIGDKIVYPMHGAGVIEAVEEKEILGVRRKYYIMKMPLDDMRVMIPLDAINSMGIRQVISKEEVEKVFSSLQSDEMKTSLNWNRRYRVNMDRLKTGDIYEVAEVVRSLILRDREKTLSTGERKILNNAKQILLSEVILAAEMTEEEVMNTIEKLIK